MLAWLRRLLAVTIALTAAPVLAVTPAASMADMRVDIYGADQGLPTLVVLAVRQGPDGRLWLGTREGVISFDGSTFTVEQAGGAADQQVVALEPSGADAMWWVSDGRGLVRSRAGTLEPLTRRQGLPHDYVRAVVETPAGELFVGTAVGVFRRAAGGRFVRVPGPDDAGKANVRSLALGPDGRVWMGARDGLAVLEGDRFVPGPVGAPEELIWSLHVDADGTVWVGAQRTGLYEWRDGRWTSHGPEVGLPRGSVSALLRDRAGRLWAAIEGGGLFVLESSRWRAIAPVPGVCERKIRALAEDDEGGLWLATVGCGVVRLSDHEFTRTVPRLAPGIVAVNALAEGRDGDLWLGYADGTLLRVSADGREIAFGPSAGLDCDVIARVDTTRAGDVWVTCSDGRVHRSAGDGFATVPLGLKAPIVVAAGNQVWAYSSEKVRRLQPPPAQDVDAGPAASGITSLHVGGSGRVYLSSDAGLVVLDGLGRAMPLAATLRGIRSLHELTPADVWLAGDSGGLVHVTPAGTRHVGVGSGLPCTSVYFVTSSADDRLWGSCATGAFAMQRNDGNGLPVVDAWGPRDGIDMMNGGKPRPVGLRRRNGRISFAAGSGVVTFDPARVRTPPPTSVAIQQVAVDGQAMPLAGAGESGPGRGDVEVTYGALALAAPETLRFRHRLEGYDTNWVDAAGRRSVRYTNLPPGTYRLRVAARRRHGAWTEAKPYVFTLRPHLHERPAFWMLAGLAALAFGVGLHRLRLRAERARLEAIATERARIAEDVHDTLAQGFVAVGVQLECVETALETNPARAGEYVQRARRAVQESLGEARQSIWAIRPRALAQGSLPEALTVLTRALGGRVPVELNVTGEPRDLSPSAEESLFRVAQEGISNALRHSRASRVRIELAYADGMVRLTITDDGKGIAATTGTGTSGHGMQGMQRRARRVGARLEVLSDERGTTLRMELRA